MLIVSFHMFSAIRHINLSNPVEAIPSVLIILMMTITGSISDGIVVGVIAYAVFSTFAELKRDKGQKTTR